MILPHLTKDASNRYPAIDIFRGVAIFTMLAANTAAGSLLPPHHFWFRIYGSFAAPIFIFLAGFMVGIGHDRHSFWHFIKRGLEILIVGALIDYFIWKIIPFTTFDVLYLIGFGIPVAAISLKLKTPVRVLLCLLFFAMGPILQHIYCYEPEVHEFALKDVATAGFHYPDGIKWWIKSLFFDGWFPIFPWMGFVLAGTLAFTHGSRLVNNIKVFLPLGIVLFFAGLTWLYFHRPLEQREEYSEFFYPPGIAYLCAAFGAIIIGLSTLKYLQPKYGLQLLRYLGSCSLFIYIFHSALTAFVLDNYFTKLNLGNYLIMYACFSATMIFFAWGLFVLKQKPFWSKMPKFLRFIFGG